VSLVWASPGGIVLLCCH